MSDGLPPIGFERASDALVKNAGLTERLSYLPQEQLIEAIVRNFSEPYKTFDILTTTAQVTPTEVALKGGVLQIAEVTNNDLSAYVEVRFNSPSASAIKLSLGDRIVTPFRTLYISWPAQSGITVKLAVGQEFDNVFRLDKNLQGNLGSVTSIGSITGSQAGLTVLPSGATAVNKSGEVLAAAGYTTIHTVTSAKSLYLLHASLDCMNDGASGVLGGLLVTNAADVIQYYIYKTIGGGTASRAFNSSFLPATYIIPAGYKIKVGTASGSASQAGSIAGYEL